MTKRFIGRDGREHFRGEVLKVAIPEKDDDLSMRRTVTEAAELRAEAAGVKVRRAPGMSSFMLDGIPTRIYRFRVTGPIMCSA